MDIDLHSVVETFLAESAELLEEAEDAMVVLETRPNDLEPVQTLFRVMHTIKGNAVSLDFAALSGFAGVLENLLERLRSRTLGVDAELVTALLASVDVLRELLESAKTGVDELSVKQQTLLTRLNAFASEHDSPHADEPAAALDLGVEVGTAFGFERAASLRVGIEKLDRLLNVTGEVAIARGRLRQAIEASRGQVASAVIEALEDTERLQLELQEQVMKLRMVPIGPVFRPFVRVVRDAALGSGKLARLLVSGGDVEIDATVLQHLRDPLTHMVRNAIAHGVETPDKREALGKDRCGTLRLRAYHHNGGIVVELEDDGAGVDRKRVRARAEELGWIAPGHEPSEAELMRFLFEPGFSTAVTVDQLAGRGVGMDVVKRNVEALRGSVAIASREGQGTTFSLRLPLTVAIIDGFGIGVGEETYVLPLENVVECLELEHGEPEARGGVVNLRGKALPFLRLRHVFEVEGEPPERENVVVVRCGATNVGIVADVLHGHKQTVIRPLGKLFERLPGVAGGAILGNGRVALILDVAALLRTEVANDGSVSAETQDFGAESAQEEAR